MLYLKLAQIKDTFGRKKRLFITAFAIFSKGKPFFSYIANRKNGIAIRIRSSIATGYRQYDIV